MAFGKRLAAPLLAALVGIGCTGTTEQTHGGSTGSVGSTGSSGGTTGTVSPFGSASLSGVTGLSPNVTLVQNGSTDSDGGPDLSQDQIALVQAVSSVGMSCSSVQAASSNPADFEPLEVAIAVYTNGPPVSAQAYAVVPNPSGSCQGGTGPGCAPTTPWATVEVYDIMTQQQVAFGASGTVTLSEADTTVTGTFTAAMTSTDGGAAAATVSGSFSGTYCANSHN